MCIRDSSKDYEVIADNGSITGVVLQDDGKSILLKAVEFIDATQNADIARAAGAEYDEGLAELGLEGERGCDTLVFQLSGVDWNTVKETLKNDGNENTGADEASAWGYSEITDCEISDPDKMCIRDRFCLSVAWPSPLSPAAATLPKKATPTTKQPQPLTAKP